ncbi:protein DFG10 [Aspergillus bombycis]|uniref:Polyprenal reductase n=1 Tax=Aspergillus bombycis TaxID=109264 RepID=A0A1F7ZYU8_9EURO|nr:protein DFG10 [Aspergillus bombycis]OGM44620.1 protein DFG10 [Aspergillus bombycis]
MTMDFLPSLVDRALATAHMDAVDVLRAFFLFASCTILSVSLLDSLRSRFVPYGARATVTVESDSTPSKPSSSSPITHILDYLASLKVPHSYFTQFYVISLLSSIFWALQLMCHGQAFQAIATRVHSEHLQRTMSINQVMLCWVLMLAQGVRRLHECFAFSRPSSSQMWFVHWLAGIAFYLAVSIALWIEGTETLLSHRWSLDDVTVNNAPSLRTFLCLPIFLFASGLQHDAHHYLFSLKKYTLPSHPLFRSIVCPHYTAECAIYLSLALLAAPQGEMINKTVLSAVVFVTVNLGVTASETKRWYMQKFGENSVRERWNMIPWVY